MGVTRASTKKDVHYGNDFESTRNRVDARQAGKR